MPHSSFSQTRRVTPHFTAVSLLMMVSCSGSLVSGNAWAARYSPLHVRRSGYAFSQGKPTAQTQPSHDQKKSPGRSADKSNGDSPGTAPDVSGSISLLISHFIGDNNDASVGVHSPSEVSPLSVLHDKANDQQYNDLFDTLESERQASSSHQIIQDLAPDTESVLKEIEGVIQPKESKLETPVALTELLAGLGHGSLNEPGLSTGLDSKRIPDVGSVDHTFGDVVDSLPEPAFDVVKAHIMGDILGRLDSIRGEAAVDFWTGAVGDILKAAPTPLMLLNGEGHTAEPPANEDPAYQLSDRIAFKVAQSLYGGDEPSEIAGIGSEGGDIFRCAVLRAADYAVAAVESRVTSALRDRLLKEPRGDAAPNRSEAKSASPVGEPALEPSGALTYMFRAQFDYVDEIADAGAHFLSEQLGLIEAGLQESSKARDVFELTLKHFIRDNDEVKARAGFLAAIQADPAYAAPRYNLAMLAESDEHWDEAIKWLQEFRKLDAVSHTAVRAELEIERINVIRDLDKTPEGKVKRRYDDDITLAKRLLSIGMPKDAVREASAAARMDAGRWEAYALSGAALAAQSDYEGAAAMLQKGLDRAAPEKRPGLQAVLDQCKLESHYKAVGLAGTAALEMRDYKRAAALFEEGWQLFPMRGAYGLAAALAWTGSGDMPKAKEYLDRLSQSKDPETVRKARQMQAKIAAGQMARPGAGKLP